MAWPHELPSGALGDPVANLADILARLLRETQSPQRRSQWGRPASQGRRIQVPWTPGSLFGTLPRGYATILEAETDDTPQVVTVDIDPPYLDPTSSFWAVRWSTLRGEGARSNLTDQGVIFDADYLPPWGISIPLAGGRIVVEAVGWSFPDGAHPPSEIAQISASLAPGACVRTWEYDFNSVPNITLGGGGTYPLWPNRYSRTLRITVYTGTLQLRNTALGPVLATLTGPTSFEAPAFPYVLTTSIAGGGATFGVQWETVRAT